MDFVMEKRWEEHLSAKQKGLVIGVDVGGTKVAAGLVDANGEILSHNRNAMVCNTAASGLESVIKAIETARAQAKLAGEQSEIRAIGICAPGPLDPSTGVIVNPPNLPCWRNFPLAAEVAQRYSVPVTVDNDGNAAGLAEALWGAARGYRNVFYATFGTGVGTAIVFDNKIYHGRTGAAAEGGHLSINFQGPLCACGKHGCIEAYASGPNIARRARAKLESGRSSSLLDLTGGKPEHLTGEMVSQALKAGDPVAGETMEEIVQLLAYWFGNIIDLLEPDVMVIGGGVSAMLQPYFGEIEERLPACCLNQRCREIPLVPARYGDESGIAGGAAICVGTVSNANAALKTAEQVSK
jgi:glucokinase